MHFCAVLSRSCTGWPVGFKRQAVLFLCEKIVEMLNPTSQNHAYSHQFAPYLASMKPCHAFKYGLLLLSLFLSANEGMCCHVFNLKTLLLRPIR